VEREDHYWQVAANDQARVAADYAPLVLRWKDGNAVRLADVAEVTDSVQDVRNFGVANGKPAMLLQVYKQPGANIMEAVDRCARCCRSCRPHPGGHRHQSWCPTARPRCAPRSKRWSARC
jgi:multidrug efflux pump subunit AcrB